MYFQSVCMYVLISGRKTIIMCYLCRQIAILKINGRAVCECVSIALKQTISTTSERCENSEELKRRVKALSL